MSTAPRRKSQECTPLLSQNEAADAEEHSPAHEKVSVCSSGCPSQEHSSVKGVEFMDLSFFDLPGRVCFRLEGELLLKVVLCIAAFSIQFKCSQVDVLDDTPCIFTFKSFPVRRCFAHDRSASRCPGVDHVTSTDGYRGSAAAHRKQTRPTYKVYSV